jgi:membrane protease YdiL (CAAX protease family)
MRKLKIPASEMGITSKKWKKSLFEGILASVVFAGLFFVFYKFAKHYSLVDVKPIDLSVGNYFPMFVYFIQSAAQELFARGFLQTTFQRFFNDHKGIKSNLLASLFFSLIHIHFGIIAVVVTFMGSLLFGALYLRHHNMIGVSIFHWTAGVCFFGTGIL